MVKFFHRRSMVAIGRFGVLLGLVALSSCSRYINVSQVETNIQADIERQGRRLSLTSVICPNRVAKQAEAYFRCVGELPDGGQFTVNVIQQDDEGTLSWDVPSSKALINLASLEETIQAEIRQTLGKRLVIDCRDTYRVNRRGDSFECDVVGTGAIASGRVDSVLVRVNGTGDLEWQEMIVSSVPVAAGAAIEGQAAASTPGTAPETAATEVEDDERQ
ncbi:MAG: DUF4333 domain-containing protein [Cyanobacteria bacterium P01_A01_bin.15]